MKITLLSLGTILFAASLIHALPAMDTATVKFLHGSQLVKLNEVKYTHGTAKGTYDLKLCINDTILNEDATVVIKEGSTETNIEGTQDGAKTECFDFTDVKLPTDKEIVQYDLHLHTGGSMSGPFGRVIYDFRRLDKVTNFKCAGESYSRIVYPSAPMAGNNDKQTCIENSNVCYMHGSSSASGGNGSLCLPGTDTFLTEDMTYCQPGTVEDKTTDDLDSSSLHYDGHYDFSYENSTTKYTSETILSVAGDVKISKTSDNKVAIENFVSGTDIYTVCAVQLDQSQNINIVATSSIQDLNVHGEDEYGDCQMTIDNSKYTNKYYHFSSTSHPSSYDVVCKRSQFCFGFVDCKSSDEMTVTYDTGKNVIVVPYQDLKPIPEPTTTAAPTAPPATTAPPAPPAPASTKKHHL